MALKKAYLADFIPIYINRNSKEYTDKLNEKGLEGETLPISFFALPYKQYDEDDAILFSSIDSRVHHEIGMLLLDGDLLGHLDPICSILKQGYVDMILSEINTLNLRSLNKELLSLYGLTKNYNVENIRFQTNQTKVKLTIENPYLLAAIMQFVKQNIFTGSTLIRIATLLENGLDDGVDVRTSQKQTLFNLLFYILSNDVYIKEPAETFIQNGKVTNEFCRFIFSFLKSARIVSEEELGYPEEKSMRNWIIRLPLKSRMLSEYIKGNFDEQYDNEIDAFIDTLNGMDLD